MINFLIGLGTRPEALKLAPLILAMKKHHAFEVTVCNTGQHTTLAESALSRFGLHSDLTLKIESNQPLPLLQANLLRELNSINIKSFDAVIAQGDTMSVFALALSAFYNHVPFFHIEAGLRSFDLENPFPEEMIRQAVARMATLNFSPTQANRESLIQEDIDDHAIIVTGNTGIDALLYISSLEIDWGNSALAQLRHLSKIVLVTVHRRENHGENLKQITQAISELAKIFPDHQFILPVHPNPHVYDWIHSNLSSISNVHLLEPLQYDELIYCIKSCELIITDSGGIQEEAPTFNKPVLVMRTHTERHESLKKGYSMLMGTDQDTIINTASNVLTGQFRFPKDMTNPYGDGLASERIIQGIMGYFERKKTDEKKGI